MTDAEGPDNTVTALVDALKVVCGVIAANDPIAGQRLSVSFSVMAQQYLSNSNGEGVVVMRLLQDHLEKQLEVLRLSDAVPKGRS